MSDNVSPELASLATLSKLVQNLGDELASYRKRALTAEARLKTIEERAAEGGVSLERSLELQKENADFKARLEEAEKRTAALLEKVRFLRQQHDREEVGP